MDGTVRAGERIRSMATGNEFDVTEVGVFTPQMRPVEELTAGEVGYIAASIKSVAETKVGDTITLAARPAAQPLPGYKQVNPMVFCGVYPADGADYDDLRDALDKLRLNDAALSFEPETSNALGYGFRCGFLGLLHMEIVQSGSSASSTSTWSRPRRRSSTACACSTGRSGSSTTRPTSRPRRRSTSWRSRSSTPTS